MPLSIYQLPLEKGLLQTEFNPHNHSIVNLYENGGLISVSVSGNEEWRLTLPCKPIVFRINTQGDLAAILGEGILIFYDIWARKTRSIAVDQKLRSLNFYKNCAVLSGFVNYYILVTPGGKNLKTISFDFLIHQIKTIPFIDYVLIYNQNVDLVCTHIDGKVEWLLEGYRVYGEIEASEKGLFCCFIKQPSNIVRFDIKGDTCFEITEPLTVRQLSLSLDGMFLLVLDADNRVKIKDNDLRTVWENIFEHPIRLMRISRNGDFFLTIDKDNVLTCYDVRSSGKTSSEYLELQTDKRITDKSATWSAKPGRRVGENQLHLLSVNSTGRGISAVGMDRRIFFMDDKSENGMDIYFPAIVERIGMNDSFTWGYVYGERQIKTIDFGKRKDSYTIFDEPFRDKPLVNFFHKKVFLLSKNMEVLVSDFKGKSAGTFGLSASYQKGLPCEKAGIMVYNDHELAAFSEQGKALFRYQVKGGIGKLHHSGPRAWGITKDYSLLAVDVAKKKGKVRKLTKTGSAIRILSITPLLVADDDNILYHLDDTLNIIARRNIRSVNSLFYIDHGQLYEITRSRKSFICYDGNDDMVWRYVSDGHIKESVMTPNGIVLIDGDTIHYIGLKQETESQSDYSQFLEL